MSEVERVERQIEKLSAADLAKFRAWFSKIPSLEGWRAAPGWVL